MKFTLSPKKSVRALALVALA
ncbi:MAG: hypothetical protein JWQ88_2041, partial [Rhodoferax sp.]|nr:hypothetical protein [Rhodoferax sp.]